MRKLSTALAAVMAAAVLVPAQAQAFKPDIVYVRATKDAEGIHFIAKVRMDRGGRPERKVSIKYEDDRRVARVLDDPPVSLYETSAYSIPTRDCYRVKVTARNQYGKTVENWRAERQGTDGCN